MIRRKKKMLLVVNTVAMGDMAFLFMIFFILAGNFMKDNATFTAPMSEDVERQELANFTLIMDEMGDIWLQGVRISVSEVEAGILQASGDRRDVTVNVKIHKTLERKDFLPVIEALSSSGVKVILAGDRGDPNN